MVKLAVENVTDEDEAWDSYSIVCNMDFYRVEYDEAQGYIGYDDKGERVKSQALEELLIEQVKEFKKGEK